MNSNFQRKIMTPTIDHVSWNVELTVKQGELENFRALTREMVEFAQSEEGALAYERFVSPDGKESHVYERWENSRTALAHLHAFRERYSERYSMVVERRRFNVYGNLSDELKSLLSNFGATTFLHPLDCFFR